LLRQRDETTNRQQNVCKIDRRYLNLQFKLQITFWDASAKAKIEAPKDNCTQHAVSGEGLNKVICY
jgi:hypothetical protein